MKIDDLEFTYYWIKDKKLLGRAKFIRSYLYDSKLKDWIPDENNILSDRIMGYDSYEPSDSPYKIGSTDMMSRLEVITEERANEIINELNNR